MMKKTLKTFSVALSLLCVHEASYASKINIWDEARKLSVPTAVSEELVYLRGIVPSEANWMGVALTLSFDPAAGEDINTRAARILENRFFSALAHDPTIPTRVIALDENLKTAQTAEMRKMVYSLLGDEEAATQFAHVASVRVAEEKVRDKADTQKIAEALLGKFSREDVAEYVREMYSGLPADYLASKWPEFLPS